MPLRLLVEEFFPLNDSEAVPRLSRRASQTCHRCGPGRCWGPNPLPESNRLPQRRKGTGAGCNRSDSLQKSGIESSIALNPCSHFVFSLGAIARSEGAPCKTHGKASEISKKATSDYEIPRAVELEEERFTDFQGTKRAVPAGPPEIHLLWWFIAREVGEPIPVRDPNVEFHRPRCAECSLNNYSLQ
jgi:hypothetical protein